MAIKGRHKRLNNEAVATGLLEENNARATRRDLFAARGQAGNWVLAYVAPDRIDPNPNQPRRQIERAALEELKQSIASRGILQPLLGMKASESRVQLVAGHRRLQAARELGLPRVPVVLVDHLSEEDTVIDAVIENIQRHNLEAWEEGVAYAQLAGEFGWTHDEIGRKIGKSRAYVSTRIRAAEKLSPVVKEVLATGNWSILPARKDRPDSNSSGTNVPASVINHNLSGLSMEGETFATTPLNNVEVIRRLTTLSFNDQEALLSEIGQRLNIQEKLSVKNIVELIKAGRSDAPRETGYQLSFVDMGLEELNLFHQWTNPGRSENRLLSVDELDRLIELYEKDLSKLRQVRAKKENQSV